MEWYSIKENKMIETLISTENLIKFALKDPKLYGKELRKREVSWIGISLNQKLSEDFIREFKDKIVRGKHA